MEYHNMSLADLKKVARDLPRGRKIKQYYIKSRHELIQLLTMDQLPNQFQVEKLTLAELRKEAREKGIPNLWNYCRNQLCEILYPSPKQNNQNNDGGKKHDDPEHSEGENVRIEVGKDL